MSDTLKERDAEANENTLVRVKAAKLVEGLAYKPPVVEAETLG